MITPATLLLTVEFLLTALSTFTCISVVPVATRITDDLDGGEASKSASVLLVTIWELGEAAGPLLIAPLSEMYGRYPLMNFCNSLFVACIILAAVSQSTTLFITARALTGLAVASNVLNPAIVGDMFAPESRGVAMSTIMFAPLIGGAIGPAIAGAVAQSTGWRQVLWMSAALAGACELLFLFCFRETYKVPILRCQDEVRNRECKAPHRVRRRRTQLETVVGVGSAARRRTLRLQRANSAVFVWLRRIFILLRHGCDASGYS